jgi:hypothetical protein
MRTENRWKLKLGFAGVLGAIATASFAGQMTVYPGPGFQGQGLTTNDAMVDLGRSLFANQASSAVVTDGAWEACTEAYFRGRCAQLAPGNYSNLSGSLGGLIVSVRQIAYDPGPARVVVYPDSQQAPVAAIQAPVVINPGTAPVVINTTPPGVVVSPDSRPLVVAAETRPVVISADALPVPAGPRIILYQNTARGMRAVELTSNIDDLDTRHFKDSAYAAFVSSGTWRLCDHERGRGHCSEFAPGRYESLGGLEGRVRSAYLIATTPELAANVPNFPPGRAVLYEFPNYGGRSAVVEYGRSPDLDWAHFKQPAGSLRVESGTWLVCSEIGYQGECRILGPGNYAQLTDLINSGVYSARQVWRPQYGYNTPYSIR